MIFAVLCGCGNRGDKYQTTKTTDSIPITIESPASSPGLSYGGNDGGAGQIVPSAVSPVAPPTYTKPSLVKFYVENSGSIFGYVKGSTDYVYVLNDMAQNPDFVTQNIPVDISFVNGKNPIKISHIGNSFDGKLSCPPMNQYGDINYSDLNVMFDTVLANAKNGVISILVSDGIYDIGSSDLAALDAKGIGTRTAFLKRLNNSVDNLQTLLVKMSSDFDGKYCYATNSRQSIMIHQKRPYYMWIIGDSDLVNRYYSDAYLAKLKGYQNHARYVKVGNNKLPFEIALQDCIGIFNPAKNDSHVLTRHEAYHGQFELALIVDYANLYYADAYLTDCNNYSCDLNFNVSSVTKATTIQATSAGVSYKRPFLIKVTTNQSNPRGKLILQLKNIQPGWIDASNANNENQIDANTTYGFSTLTKGIREAYEYVSDSIPAVFEITFN